MSIAIEQLKSQVRGLSAAEKVELADFLLASLEPEDEGVEEAWRAEISRRVEEIHDGTAKGRPVEEVLAELRKRYP